MSDKHKQIPHRRKGNLLRKAIGPTVVVGLGWIAYSNLFVSHNMELPPALPGEQLTINRRAGRLNAYVGGSGKPLLLIHSINAAASAYEMRPIFERYRHTRRVYALDLPGFGFSDRSDREYTPRLMTDAILDTLEIIAQDCGNEPVDAMALSLGCEFLARAATEQSSRFRSLALITPTGFRPGERLYEPPGSTRTIPLLRAIFSFPLWSVPLFDLLNTRISQRYFLMKSFGSYEKVDQGLLEYDYRTSHQPGAQHAPYAFVAGQLFSADIDRVYDAVSVPTWVAYGTRGEFSNIDVRKVTSRKHWVAQSFETGALPHFECIAAFAEAYDNFLARLDASDSSGDRAHHGAYIPRL